MGDVYIKLIHLGRHFIRLLFRDGKLYVYVSVLLFAFVLGHTNHCRLFNTKSIFIHISKVKLATIVEGNPKAPFSIATTPMLTQC